MALSPGGIWFEELQGSPKISMGQSAQGVKATREFRVNWSDWQAFCYELIGQWSVFGATPQYLSPIAFPGLPNLVVSDLDVEPFDGDSPDGLIAVDLGSQTNTYELGAKITAQYVTMWLGMEPAPAGTTLDISGDEGAEMMTIPGRTFKGTYQSGGANVSINMPEDVNVGLVVPTGTYTMNWGRVPAPSWTALRELRGKVNAYEWFGAAPETVMYQGFSYRRMFQLSQDDGMLWQIGMKFAESVKQGSGGEAMSEDGGWNHFYFPGKGWTRVVDTKTGMPPYDLADFSQLFEFDLTLLPFSFTGS